MPRTEKVLRAKTDLVAWKNENALRYLREFIFPPFLLLCACLGLLAYFVTSTQAAATHNYLSRIAEVPEGAGAPLSGPLTEVDAMTVNSGNLWVTEQITMGGSGYRVDEFDASSLQFKSQLPQPPSSVTELRYGVAVGDFGNISQVYVGGATKTQEGVVAVFSQSGESWTYVSNWGGQESPSKTFGIRGVSDIAVDNSASLSDWAAGDVYVCVKDEFSTQDVVDVYEPEAGGKVKYVTQITGPPGGDFKNPQRVAVDSANGDVFIADSGEIYIFEPEPLMRTVYKFLFTIKGPPSGGTFDGISGLAVDASDGDIFVAEEANKIISEFNLDHSYIGQITGDATPTASFGEISPHSVAVDTVTHHVFVGDYRDTNEAKEQSFVDVFGPDVVIPDVTTAAATNIKPSSVTLNGTVNPDKEGEATCKFAWGTTKSLGEVTSCSEPVEGSAPGPVPVQATLNGLEPDTTYFYRLEATNANGTNAGEEWENRHVQTSGPGIHGEWASSVASTSATLGAEINPDKSTTAYYFQYGATTNYGVDAPVQDVAGKSDAIIGPGEDDTEVSQHVTDLSEKSTYHYRVVAVSEIEPQTKPGQVIAFYGPDHVFTTQALQVSPGLANGRSWELVSPANKHGALVAEIDESGVIQVAENGGKFTYVTNAPTEPEPQGYTNDVQVLANRGMNGWVSHDIATFHNDATTKSVGQGQEYRFFSADLSSSVVEPFGSYTPLSEVATERTPYLRRESLCENETIRSGCYWPIVTSKEDYADVPLGTEFDGSANEPFGAARFVGGTPNLDHVVLKSLPALTATTSTNGLYEWSLGQPVREQIALVSVLPESEGGTSGVPGQLGSGGGAATSNAISNDGSRIFWSTEGSKESLYLRDVVKGETIRLDTVQPGASGAGIAKPVFQTASIDGSRVFFTDKQRLVGQSGSQGADLYECEISENEAGKLECQLTDLTVEVDARPADVLELLGASEDGSYVYFVAQGVLSGRANSFDSIAASGENNLYMIHYDSASRHWEEPSFIAALSDVDSADWNGILAHHTSRVSPNGRYLAFMSDRSLTGYDNTDLYSGAPDEEVFLYDSRSGRLVCVSCEPTGGRPTGLQDDSSERLVEGFNVMKEGVWFAANIPGWTPYTLERALYQSRYLSNNGRLFFNSNDPLVPQDINGTEDVYEYEPINVGNCSASSGLYVAADDGCVGLISSGTSAEESGFLDATATGGRDGEGDEGGGEMFFLTSAKLVSQDFDTAFDVYDARECTAQSPCATEPVSLAVCTTVESCRAAPSPQPTVFGPGASATFSGTGNIMEPISKSVVKAKHVIDKRDLVRKLRACKKKKGKARVACERKARKPHGPVRAGKGSTKGRGRR